MTEREMEDEERTNEPVVDDVKAPTEAQKAYRAQTFDPHSLEAALMHEREQRAWKPRPFLMPVRVAISGKTETPPLMSMLAALGRERSLARLRDAIALLAEPD